MVKKNLDAPVTLRQFEEFKDEQKKIHSEMLDAILSGMDEIANNIRRENQEEHKKTRAQIAELREKNEAEHSFTRDEINGLKAELSKTPSRREFEEIKARLKN